MTQMNTSADLICLSHLRWGFVFQRPQHLLSRFARTGRVFFFEEAAIEPGPARLLVNTDPESGVHVAVPHFPPGLSQAQMLSEQRCMLDQLIRDFKIQRYFLWYYTPMAVPFTNHLHPDLTVYDCMDELTAFQGAPPALREYERQLFAKADLVFTGGHSLYEAKREQHANVHAFPSSVDVAHFSEARKTMRDPADQEQIPHPRIGYCGVIDERMDLELIGGVAKAHPEWHLVMIGPVVKIDPATLPKSANIHYLGGKTYKELPAYIAGWDAAMLPFAQNESTRFISPTKTPEYLAAGKPTISTPIRDVVRPYGEKNLVYIAGSIEEFVAAIESALGQRISNPEWLSEVDKLLASNSWDTTWMKMMELIAPRLDSAVATEKTATV